MTTKKGRVFDASLKLEVVRMVKEQGQSVQNVSETMGIGQTATQRWLTQYSAEQCGGQVISDTTIGSRAAIFRS